MPARFCIRKFGKYQHLQICQLLFKDMLSTFIKIVQTGSNAKCTAFL